MKEKILLALKGKYPNVSTKFLGFWAEKLSLKVTEEGQIEGVVNELDNLPVSITDLAADWQKEGDARVNTAKQEWLKTPPKPDKPTKTDPPVPSTDPATPPTEMPEWFKPFAQKMEALESEKAQTTIQQKLSTRLKDVPAVFYKGRMPKTEEELETVAAEIEADYTAFKQETANASANGGPPPRGSGGANDTKPSADLVDYVKQRVTAESKKTT